MRIIMEGMTIECNIKEAKELFLMFNVVNKNEKRDDESNSKGYEQSSVSPYARLFDDTCVGWTKDPEYNLMFLKDQEKYANQLLKSKGHLFLNEVYDMLGFPRTKAGAVVGWIYNEEEPYGDNCVDFGIYNTAILKNCDFVNGYSKTVILDFNVDGNIIDWI